MEQLNNKTQIRYAQIRANGINEEDRTIDFDISSEAVDSFRSVFKLDGWELDDYTRNPIVCYNHDAFGDADHIIGTSEVFRDGDVLVGRLTFEDEEINPFAEKIFRKVKAGTLRMASIRADIKKARMGLKDQGEDPDVIYFTQHVLREWSVVSIGSNPDALKRNNEELEALRTAVAKDIEVDPEPPVEQAPKVRALDAFEAQLIVNKNRSVK